MEAAPLGVPSLVKQFGNSSANKVRGFRQANVEFKPETQKLKELYELGYSNVSTKLSKMKSTLEATYNLQTNTLAGAAETNKIF